MPGRGAVATSDNGSAAWFERPGAGGVSLAKIPAHTAASSRDIAQAGMLLGQLHAEADLLIDLIAVEEAVPAGGLAPRCRALRTDLALVRRHIRALHRRFPQAADVAALVDSHRARRG